MVLICGIDEAGRGPVLGPLVIAATLVAEEDISRLEELGVKDSKLLSPAKREELYDKILEIVKGYELMVVPPELIDQYVLSHKPDENLNWLEANKAADAINKLEPDRAIIDCPSTNITAFACFVREKLHNKKIELICEHKADMKYMAVAAASILAKVSRDKAIDDLKKKVGVDFGSGYPSDPKTQAFLKDYWDKCDFFRKSWSSWKKYSEMKKQKTLGEW